MTAAVRAAAWIALFASTLAGCDAVRLRWATAGVARAYDDALITAYRTGDLAPLAAVAGPGEVRRVTALVDLKRASGLVLECSLEDFSLLDSTRTATGVTVRTRERWTYHDRPARPGGVGGPVFTSEMTMEYQLVHEDGHWRVLEGRTLSSRYLQPPGAGPRSATAGHGIGERGGR